MSGKQKTPLESALSLQCTFKKVDTFWGPVPELPLRRGCGKVPCLSEGSDQGHCPLHLRDSWFQIRGTGNCTSKRLTWDVNNIINGERRSSDTWIIRFLLQAVLAGRGGPGRRLCNENVLPIKRRESSLAALAAACGSGSWKAGDIN